MAEELSMESDTGTLKTGKLAAVSDLIRLPSQYGTLLVLWPTLWSLFIASNGRPGAKLLAIFILGTFLMRSAGCAINDVADRDFDPHVHRTKKRPVASGRLSVREALFVFAALSALAFGLVLFLNTYTIILSFVGLLLAGVYPFAKRVSYWPQAVLGMAFGWGSVMAWGAVHGQVGPVALLIFVANIFWSMGYDTIYALMDIDDDLRIGVKSTAIFFGRHVYKALCALYCAAALLLGLAGAYAGLGRVFFGGLAVALAAFLGVVGYVRKNPTREAAFRGFVANAFIGGAMLAVIFIDMNL